MKEIYLMRHGAQSVVDKDSAWDPEAPLTPEGTLVIKRVTAAHLRRMFQVYGSSPLRRAMETLNVVAAAQQIPHLAQRATFREMAALGPDIAEWDQAVAIRAPKNVQEVHEYHPGLFRSEGAKIFGAMKKIATQLTDDEAALFVSHQPLVEAAAAFATQTYPPVYELKKGEILVFTFEGGVLAKIEHLPLPE